jgi:hypothetical protein
MFYRFINRFFTCSVGFIVVTYIVAASFTAVYAAGTTIGLTITLSDIDHDGTPDETDADMDDDGVLNIYDDDVDGDGLLNTVDPNDDEDLLLDGTDTAQPNDANGFGTLNDVDGDGIPNNVDADIDGDGIANIWDIDSDGDGIPNSTDTDDDNDGLFDAFDPSPRGALPWDVNADGVLDAIDADMDGDGILNIYDNDVDGDGIFNALDTDDDSDGIVDSLDTTQPNDANGFGTLADVDGDGTLNALDYDMDGDGILNSIDNDVDGDGVINALDIDDDNDGILDGSDSTPRGIIAPIPPSNSNPTPTPLPSTTSSNASFGGGWTNVIATASDLYTSITSTGTKNDSSTTPKTIIDPEIIQAYIWAKKYGITTMQTAVEARLYDPLTRAELAKMMSVFSIHIAWKKLTQDPLCNVMLYSDNALMDSEQKKYIWQACHLWLMWWKNGIREILPLFNPQWLVTRAEFGTVLSRFLYGTQHNGASWTSRFEQHLTALKKDGFMQRIEKPLTKDIRGYVMIVMQRIASARYSKN